MAWVRWRTSRSRVRNTTAAACACSLFTATKCMVGAERQRCEKRQKLAAAQLLAKDHRARAVGSMKLKDALGEIQSNGAHRVRGRFLECLAPPPLWHAEAVGGVHHQAPPA